MYFSVQSSQPGLPVQCTGTARVLSDLAIYVFDTESFDTQLCSEKQSCKCGSETRTDCFFPVAFWGGVSCSEGCKPAFILH